jgi:DNA-binding NarL/FixJ family response regulator
MHPSVIRDLQRSADPTLRIVVADDHALVREGLQRLIDEQDDMVVVGEAKNGTDAVRLVAELQPAILLVDLSMPDLTGVEVTRAVQAATPGTQVIGVTRHRDAQSVAAMVDAGAAGYVLKQSPSEELLRAIRTVAAGAHFIDPAVPQIDAARQAIIEDDGAQSHKTQASHDDLEWAVLDLFATAHSDRDIADRLSVEPADVHATRVHAMQKAGLRTRVQVAAYLRAQRQQRRF